jgi:hypothetical protein
MGRYLCLNIAPTFLKVCLCHCFFEKYDQMWPGLPCQEKGDDPVCKHSKVNNNGHRGYDWLAVFPHIIFLIFTMVITLDTNVIFVALYFYVF